MRPRPQRPLLLSGPCVEGTVFTGLLLVGVPFEWVFRCCYCPDRMQENPSWLEEEEGEEEALFTGNL